MGPVASVQSVVENLNHPELEVEDTALAVLRLKFAIPPSNCGLAPLAPCFTRPMAPCAR